MLLKHPDDNSSKPITSELGKAAQEFEAQQNLTGVFSLLMTIDKRMNPQTYSTKQPVNEYA